MNDPRLPEEHKAIRQRVLREIAMHFKSYEGFIKKDSRVLDIGIGPGFTAEYIKQNRPDIEIEGLDVLDLRQTKSVNITLYKGTRFPWQEKVFDLALLFYTLHHIKWPGLILDEVTRTTRGGILIIEEFRAEEIDVPQDEQYEADVHLALGIPMHIEQSYFSMSELEKLFVDKKLAIVEKRKLKSLSPRKIEKRLYVLAHNYGN